MTSGPPLSLRQQLAAELIMEDESLTSDLPDDSARALVAWATATVVAAAGEETCSDEQLSMLSRAVRAAVHTAAQADLHQPAGLVSLAEATLAATQPAATLPAAPRVASPSVPAALAQPADQQGYWAQHWIDWLRGDH